MEETTIGGLSIGVMGSWLMLELFGLGSIEEAGLGEERSEGEELEAEEVVEDDEGDS